MRRRGPLTLRHLVVAVLVVVVVNAQLSWWIIFVLSQNRTRLRLERQRLVAAVQLRVERVRLQLVEAGGALAEAVAAGLEPGAVPPPPFAAWGVTPSQPCRVGWALEEVRLVRRLAGPQGCVRATVGDRWQADLLAATPDLEIVPLVSLDTSGPPAEVLPAPLDALAVRPVPELWEGLLQGYRGRIVMMVSEGSFFALLLFVLVGLLVRTLRREAELERHHRNFLSAITHELKSPLASMRLSLETVLSGRAAGGDRDHFLGNALRDTERLQGLVQKVLEVTRYDRGGGRLALREVSLSRVVEDAVAAFEMRARLTEAELESEVAPDVWGHADEEGLAIVVSNLLENAVKYGGREPRVRVSLEEAHGKAVLEVSDNGAGIPPDEVPLVFDRFYRGGDEMTRTTEGTGLGLYLVQQIVAGHRGAVRVADTGPGGTTLRVTLPGARRRESQP